MPLPLNQQIVGLNAAILQGHAIVISREARILDFGCGSGRHTYEYLDEGFENTVGFDIQDYVELRSEVDRRRFHFLEEGEPFRLPFPNDHFDLIASTSVFEHVANLDESISEIARVLKPSGASLHAFPPRWRPIEPHIFVPFGGSIQSRWWFSLWAHLGVRNEFQKGLTASETVSHNLEYCESGVHYPAFQHIDDCWRRRFKNVEYVEPAYIEATSRFSKVSRMAGRLMRMAPPLGPQLVKLYRTCHFRVILASEPRGS
jgi:SAM-dependent methyltransferase